MALCVAYLLPWFFTLSAESVLGMYRDAARFVHVHWPTDDRLLVLILIRAQAAA